MGEAEVEKDPLAVSQGRLHPCLSGERVRFPWVGVQSVNWFVSHCGIFGVSFGGFVLFSTGEEEEDPRARV